MAKRKNGFGPSSEGSNKPMAMMDDAASKLKLALFLACFWPFVLLSLFHASSPGQASPVSVLDRADAMTEQKGLSSEQNAVANSRLNLRSVLDRVDVVGYGPTHPRVAVLIIGEEKDDIVASVESLYSNTDLNRIMVVCAVLDGAPYDHDLVSKLKTIENGAVPHWHGVRADLHLPGTRKAEEDEDPHSKKIHVIFNPTRQGVASSRLDAVEFVQILESKHENAGLKSPDEDLILLLLEAGTKLKDTNWLGRVTQALIVPPPILGLKEENIAMKLANAISFHVEGPGKRTSFDEKFTPLVTDATADDINLSNGQSYPTPALNGAAVALRLNTFVNLPAQDPSLIDPWAANLDLSLNLWLCADGIDIMEDVEVTPPVSNVAQIPLEPEMAARFAAVWMDETIQPKFFQAYSSTWTRLDWETKVAKARQSKSTPVDLARRCRSFEWYAKEVNPDLSKILAKGGWEHDHEEEIAKKRNSVAADSISNGNVDAKENAQAAELPEHLDPPPIVQRKEEAHSEALLEDEIPNLAKHHKNKPSKPLREENSKIVGHASPISISFEDVSGGHKEHPHMGATDENGVLGYIHDETALRRDPPTLEIDESLMKKFCTSHDNHYRMMKERIVVDRTYDQKMEESGTNRDKIFCLVYTIDAGHPKIPSIRETWGYAQLSTAGSGGFVSFRRNANSILSASLVLCRPKCDGFMVGSNKTDPSIGTVNIVHEGPEECKFFVRIIRLCVTRHSALFGLVYFVSDNNIWQKVRSMWSYIYDHYYDKYDWFHIGGDDLFLLVENLRYYVESEEIKTAANGGVYFPDGTETTQTPLLLGRRFAYMGDLNEIFDSGGSGYTMNKAALKLLVTEGFVNYFPHAHT
ncbi:MAG: hypothetical protein SGILL_004598, partial [Bacillariaceae sp.]